MIHYHLGQKVVCIDDLIRGNNLEKVLKSRPNWPVKGQFYHIRGIVRFCFDHGWEDGVYLEELVNPVIYWETNGLAEHPFGLLKRFRPLIEKKLSTETGMAILRKIAQDAGQKKEVILEETKT